MRRWPLLVCACLLLVASSAFAQVSIPQTTIANGATLPATCSPGGVFMDTSASPWIVNTCTATNTWTPIGSGSGGGSVTPDSTTTFTNKSGLVSQWSNDAQYVAGTQTAGHELTLGTTTLTLPIVPPADAAPTLAAGTAGTPSGTYVYTVTFTTDSGGETSFGTPSDPITVTSKRILLTGIPLSTDGRVTGRKIYRYSDSMDTSCCGYLVGTLADNSTTTYTDNTADATGVTNEGVINSTGLFLMNGEPILVTPWIDDTSDTQILIGTQGRVPPVGSFLLIGALAGTAIDESATNLGATRLTFVGNGAGQSLTSGHDDNALGDAALQWHVTGNNNTGLGYNAGIFVVAGDDGVYLGSRSGATAQLTINNSIALGTGARVSGSNEAVIGDVNVLNVYLGSESAAASLHASDVLFTTGKALKSDTTTGHTYLFDVYDTNTGPGYVTWATVTNGDAPSVVISAPTGGTTLTVGGLNLTTAVSPASSGTRFLCISTTGAVTSSSSACSGT